MSKTANTYEEFKGHTDRVRKHYGVTVRAVLVVLGEWDGAGVLRNLFAGRTLEQVTELYDHCEHVKVAGWHEEAGAEATEEFKATTSSDAWKYDSGYGTQELFGVIWYSDGSHSRRGEYDGSEWWEYVPTPEVPAWLRGR